MGTRAEMRINTRTRARKATRRHMDLLFSAALPPSSMAGGSMMPDIRTAGGEDEDAASTRAEEGTAGIPELRVAVAGHGQDFMLVISPC